MLEDGHGEQEWQMGITYMPGASLRKVRVEELAATPARRDVKRETRNYASHSNLMGEYSVRTGLDAARPIELCDASAWAGELSPRSGRRPRPNLQY